MKVDVPRVLRIPTLVKVDVQIFSRNSKKLAMFPTISRNVKTIQDMFRRSADRTYHVGSADRTYHMGSADPTEHVGSADRTYHVGLPHRTYHVGSAGRTYHVGSADPRICSI